MIDVFATLKGMRSPIVEAWRNQGLVTDLAATFGLYTALFAALEHKKVKIKTIPWRVEDLSRSIPERWRISRDGTVVGTIVLTFTFLVLHNIVYRLVGNQILIEDG